MDTKVNLDKELDNADLSKIEKSYVTEADMKKDKNAIYLNPESGENIADLEKLTTELVKFLEYINKPQMEELQKTDYDAYIKHLESEFETFSLHYYSIFKLLTDNKDLEKRDDNVRRLISMIELLSEVKSGKKSMKKSYDMFKEELNEEFIYSKYGGKDKFEAEIKKNKKKK
jgi:hypothetical protein